MGWRVSPRHLRIVLLLGFVALVFWLGWRVEWDIQPIVDLMQSRPWWGALIYVLFLAASVTLMPLVSLPLVPFAAEAWGVFIGGTLSALGWWLGSLPPFLIARKFGRPILRWFVSLKRLEEFEKRIPDDVSFVGIVLIRLLIPVDLPSFALGLFKHLSFKTYAWATLVGTMPFAYLMVAMGGALVAGEWLLFISIGVVILAALFFLARIWRRRQKINL